MSQAPGPKPKIFSKDESALLQRCYDAIKGDLQPDIVAKLQDEIVEKCFKTVACAQAIDLAFSSVQHSETIDLNALKRILKAQKPEKADALAQSRRRYQKHVAFISIVWSMDVLEYYNWDGEELAIVTAQALYNCARVYEDFNDFVRHHNVFLWLKHLDELAKLARKEKLRFTSERWFASDLQELCKVKQGRTVKRYGHNITMSTIEEYQKEIHAWTRKRDSIVTLNGKRFDLKTQNRQNWGVYLLQYDRYGRIVQRKEADGTPHRQGMISPPNSTAISTTRKSRDRGVRGTAGLGGSTVDSLGTSSALSSPQSTIQRRIDFGRWDQPTSATYLLHSGETTLNGSPVSDTTSLRKGGLMPVDEVVPDNAAANVAEITLTDDEESEHGVLPGCSASEPGTMQQVDGNVGASVADELESFGPQEGMTGNAVDRTLAPRSNATSVSNNDAGNTQHDQTQALDDMLSELGRADGLIDQTGADVTMNSGPSPLASVPDDSLLAAAPPHDNYHESDSNVGDGASLGLTVAGGVTQANVVLTERSSHSPSQQHSAHGLFVSDVSRQSNVSSPRHSLADETLPRLPPLVQTSINNSTTSPLAGTHGLIHPSEAVPPTTRVTIPGSSTNTSTTTSASTYSSSSFLSSIESGDAASAASRSKSGSEHLYGEAATPTISASCVNLWRQQSIATPGRPGTTAKDTGPDTGLYALRDGLVKATKIRAYDPPSLHELTLNAFSQPGRHSGLLPAECVCGICADLGPLLRATGFEASLPGASRTCQSRHSWLKDARWALATDEDSSTGLSHKGSEVLFTSQASFKTKADDGTIFNKPVVIGGSRDDVDAYDVEGLHQVLLDRFRDDPIQVMDVLACHQELVTMERFLACFSSGDKPVGCSKVPESLEADRPAFVKYPRFCLLRSAMTRARSLSEDSFTEVFDRITAFTRIEAAGFFCAPRVGTFGGSWLRVMDGELLCMFVPRAETTGQTYSHFASKDLDWEPAGRQRLILLKKNDVLFLPHGIIFAHIAVKPSISLEGSFWDEKETGSYAMATRLTPECNPARVVDEIPQAAIDHVLRGLAVIANDRESRFSSDFFYRGNGIFGPPPEVAVEAVNPRDIFTSEAALSVHGGDWESPKRFCERSDAEVTHEALDEAMRYF